jgi:hypothetical protein
MANNLNPDQLAALIANVVGQVLAGQTASPKGVAAPVSAPGNSLEQKDKALINGFRRRGIPLDQIVLMDRSDRSKPHTIRPFKGWLSVGRMVRKGERGIRGLFHQSQTDEIKPAKPAPKGKAKLTPVKSQLPLV